MKRPSLPLVAVAGLLGPLLGGDAQACPCRGTFGPGAAVSQVSETWALSFSPAASVVHGGWSPLGAYRPLDAQSTQRSVDLALSAGYRPLRVLELGLQATSGWQSLHTAAMSDSSGSLGDTALHLRWMVAEEAMRDLGRPLGWPTLEVVIAARIPTGMVRRSGAAAASGTTGAVGTAATSQGLGTWEAAMGVQAEKSLSRSVDMALLGQGGYRLPDDAIGVERQLGPRLLAQLTLRYRLDPELAVGAGRDLGCEGDVRYEGQLRSGTGQRAWGAAAFATFAPLGSPWRAGVTLRHTPELDGIGVNALSTTTLALSLGYGST